MKSLNSLQTQYLPKPVLSGGEEKKKEQVEIESEVHASCPVFVESNVQMEPEPTDQMKMNAVVIKAHEFEVGMVLLEIRFVRIAALLLYNNCQI